MNREHQQAVVGAAALGDRHDRKPWHADLHRHARADQARTDRRQRIDEQAGQNAGDQAKRGEDAHRRKRKAVGLLGGSAAAACAGGREMSRRRP